MVQLRILSLNCWGLPLNSVTRYRDERFKYIASALQQSNYDIVGLQEVWLLRNYETVREAIKSVFPYAHYFHSGNVGSGKCVFSRYPIVATSFTPFNLSGYPYELNHGDWFGRKGVGHCKINITGTILNFYVTHLHAEYNRNNDVHLPHRATEIVQLSQLMRFTAHNNPAILVGDLNFEPEDVGYRFITTALHLKDAWLEGGDEGPGLTCDLMSNSFTSKSDIEKRIDYIFFNDDYLKCQTCQVTMGKIPGVNYNYSDHEGIEAILQLNTRKLRQQRQDVVENPTEIMEVLQEVHGILTDNIKALKFKHFQRYLLVILFVSLSILCGIINYHSPNEDYLKLIVIVACPLFFTVAATLFYFGFLFDEPEIRAIKAVVCDLEVWMDNIDEKIH